MPLLISRISNLSARKVVNARFFSSPCFLLSAEKVGESSEGVKIVKNRVFDSATEKVVTSCDKMFPKKLFGQTLVGASQGWVASMRCEHLPVNLTDMYKPRVTSPKVIPLPSLGFYPAPYSSTELSLSSSSPDQDQDFTVAAKFCGSHLSVCRPCWDSEWTHIETSLPLFPCSDLMFSKRDQAFYFTSVKGLYMGSLPLSNSKNKKLKYQQVLLRNLPKIPEAGQEMLDKCFMSKHLVESPSGELFLINWYTQCIHTEDKDGEVEGIESKTKRFMVFREDEKNKDFCYTEDIGDISIFLGEGEAFCLTASMYPGLKPNSIYYIGHGLGSYDLASGMVHSFYPPRAPMVNLAPFWIPSHL